MKFKNSETEYPTTWNGLLDRFFQESLITDRKQFIPAVDISEEENQFEIELSVPGMKKEDFNVEVLDGKLTISGERRMEEKKESKNFHALETQYGSFRRVFYVPEDVNQDELVAKYEAGILKLTLPKAPKKVQKAIIEVK